MTIAGLVNSVADASGDAGFANGSATVTRFIRLLRIAINRHNTYS
jgi:hypothetical protein